MKTSISFLSSRKVVDCLIELDATDTNYIHVDVMDGKFVKSKYLPFKTLNKMANILTKRLDVHLMVKRPKKFIEDFAILNTEYITIHVELDESEIFKNLELIKSYGIKCGLAINPDMDISLLKPFLDYIDMITIMSVYPGYGGQTFIEDSIKRIDDIKKLIDKRKILISIDGGINDEIKKKLKNVDILVSGSFVTNGNNYQEQINKLR